jgi:hypothetical protein
VFLEVVEHGILAIGHFITMRADKLAGFILDILRLGLGRVHPEMGVAVGQPNQLFDGPTPDKFLPILYKRCPIMP